LRILYKNNKAMFKMRMLYEVKNKTDGCKLSDREMVVWTA